LSDATALELEGLSREALLATALETMHIGHLLDRALMPQVVIATRDAALVDAVAIDEWMGASPVYTGRMRRLMGIDGDDVPAILKALQLDVGFPHQYMDVAWKLIDERRAEFRLLHCGALRDVEPHGEKRVVGMCHTIEDPTFDATAFATNPRARMRPIHRPPRVPADRMPHCHWTIEIDPTNEPVKAAAHTAQVAALPLARIAIPSPAAAPGDGMPDYRGPFDPAFRLGKLAAPTLAAVTREFRAQTHLLSCSAEIALAQRLGTPKARELLAAQWTALSWVAAGRLARALGAGGGAAGVAAVLRLLGTLPPGFARSVAHDGAAVKLAFAPESADLLDPEHPGWLGLAARGELRAVEAAAQAVDPRARLAAATTAGGRLEIELRIDPSAAPAEAPPAAGLMRFSTATAWEFDLSRAR
jgi:hypothetical protein